VLKRKEGSTIRQRTAFSHVEGLRTVLIFLFVVSGVINVLALTGSFYMLQIYDRALASQSLPTLIALSLLAVTLYAFQGVLDISRSQILVRVGARVDEELAPIAHKVTIDMPRLGFSTTEAGERGRDVDVMRQFVSGQGLVALMDLPWMPLYLIFVYMLHPLLGLLCIGGAVVLAALTVATELLTRKHAATAQKAQLLRMQLSDMNARNADVIRAMGFVGHAVARFQKANREHLDLQKRTSDVTGTLSGVSKVLRMILQSAVLGLGAYLVIKAEMSAGAIIAASVASARALAPVDMIIAQWKVIAAARRSFTRLTDTLSVMEETPNRVTLPPPARSLSVERLTVAAPNSGAVVLSDVSFDVAAGSTVGIIGPSGGGKSTLARALTGVWPQLRGNIRLDGADISQWAGDDLGRYIGYVPQDVALLDATVGENISRLDPDADGAAILAAAQAAGVHDLIVRLPEGYETRLGSNGMALSAGQRQRIALARALYGNPFLVILDEPNSNLDAEGETALARAVSGVRARGGIAIVIAHRPSVLSAVDYVGVVQQGRMVAFGPRDEILSSQTRQGPSITKLKPVMAPAASAG
jgi:PrtD family type I secretion system ABC transporter